MSALVERANDYRNRISDHGHRRLYRSADDKRLDGNSATACDRGLFAALSATDYFFVEEASGYRCKARSPAEISHCWLRW